MSSRPRREDIQAPELDADAASEDRSEAEQDEEGAPPAPWHFKVLLVGTAGYLIYRFIWFIFWLTGHAWNG